MAYSGLFENISNYITSPKRAIIDCQIVKDGSHIIIQNLYLFHFIKNSLEIEFLKVYAYIKLIKRIQSGEN